MDPVQRARLEEEKRNVLREMQEVGMAMMKGSSAPGDAGLFFTYYSQEAEVLRQRQMVLMQRLAVLNRILQTQQPKK